MGQYTPPKMCEYQFAMSLFLLLNKGVKEDKVKKGQNVTFFRSHR